MIHPRTQPKWKSHGEAKANTPEYRVWRNMRYRCYNEAGREYPIYGGRGITVCDRWSDFSLFLQDMGRRPSLHHTIDRINNDGNYEPGNCRWATAEQQNNNTSRTVKVKDDLGYSQLGRKIGASDTCVRYREKVGLPVDAPAKKFFMGEQHRKAKLTEGLVRRIREEHAKSDHPYQYILRLMDELGMSEAGLYSVVRRKSWKHIL